jgi:hypothetical protein
MRAVLMGGKMKKHLLSAIFLLGSTAADASVVPVVTRPIEMGGGASSLVFNFDEIGGAWVEERDEHGFSQGDWTTFPRFPVPQLRFDAASRQILFGRVVCANVVPMAAGYGVMNTGRCRLRSFTHLAPQGPLLETVEMEVH